MPAAPTYLGETKKKKSRKSVDGDGAAPTVEGTSAAPVAATEHMIKPQSIKPRLATDRWPLLLKHYDQLQCRNAHYTPIPSGCSPLKRELKEYVRYGVINLDKPANPSSHEVLTADEYLLVSVQGLSLSYLNLSTGMTISYKPSRKSVREIARWV